MESNRRKKEIKLKKQASVQRSYPQNVQNFLTVLCCFLSRNEKKRTEEREKKIARKTAYECL